MHLDQVLGVPTAAPNQSLRIDSGRLLQAGFKLLSVPLELGGTWRAVGGALKVLGTHPGPLCK